MKANKTAVYQNFETEDALRKASACGDIETVRGILECGVLFDINSVDKEENSALLLAAQNGHSNVVSVLVERGALPNIKRADGETPLTQASRKGHTDVARMLLTHDGTLLNVVDTTGKTPLTLAAESGHEQLTRYFVDNYYRRDTTNTEIALRVAAKNKKLGTILVLLQHGSITRPPLVWAVENGYSKVVECLLKSGCDPNAILEDGRSILMRAASKGFTNTLHRLLENNANPNYQRPTSGGGLFSIFFGSVSPSIVESNALECAIKGGHVEAVKILLEHGADTRTVRVEPSGSNAGHIRSLLGSDLERILKDRIIILVSQFTKKLKNISNGLETYIQPDLKKISRYVFRCRDMNTLKHIRDILYLLMDTEIDADLFIHPPANIPLDAIRSINLKTNGSDGVIFTVKQLLIDLKIDREPSKEMQRV